MKNFDQIKIKLKLTIGYPVANREEETFLHEHISEEEWKALGFFEKEKFIEDEILKEWAYGYIEMSSEVLEEEKEEG
ncbi:DUF7167 family protein [Acinetobacter guillouiae]|uniref:DUF7167 family protein n=1 Tax=Acinetobacter guillouiae TaxID=106649 RepID=UPI003C6FDE5C